VSSLLFVSGEYPPAVGGVGDYTDRLRGVLAERGWPSKVLSRHQIRRWDARALVWLSRAAPSTGLVHIQLQAGAFDLLGDVYLMPLLLRRARPRVRVVTTFHDVREPYLFPKAGGLRKAALRLLARTSHAVIAADERDLAALDAPSARCHQIPIGSNVSCAPPTGYDRDAFRVQLGFEPDTLVIAYFGLLNASKGLDLLLDAFELIIARGAKARLVLVGGEVGASDPSDRVTAARVRSRLSGCVTQTGWLAPAELSAHLLAADVALLPYTDGASPRRGSLLACAEHGLPIVSTRPASGPAADAVHAANASPQALADAVLEVADDPALSAGLRARSRALAETVAWPRIAEAHIAIYEKFASPSGRGRAERG
jgi:glycosyltransferase involved in cell wall biosynthesis